MHHASSINALMGTSYKIRRKIEREVEVKRGAVEGNYMQYMCLMKRRHRITSCDICKLRIRPLALNASQMSTQCNSI